MTREYPTIGISNDIFELITDDSDDWRVWSDEDARRSFEWITNSISGRTQALLQYLRINDGSVDHDELLLQVGKSVAEILPDPQFSAEPDEEIFRIEGLKVLTPIGTLLGVDIGLLIAQMLLKVSDKLVWDIDYSDEICVSFHHPVLVGFRHDMMYDPFEAALPFTVRVLNKERTSDSWALLYKYWKDLI